MSSKNRGIPYKNNFCTVGLCNKKVSRTGACRFSQARTLDKEKGSRINARINRRIKVTRTGISDTPKGAPRRVSQAKLARANR